MSKRDRKLTRSNKSTDNKENEFIGEKSGNGDTVIKKKNKKKSAFAITMIILFFIIVLATAGTYVYLQSFSKNSVNIGDSSGGSKNTSEIDEQVKDEIKDSTNILVVGVDLGTGDEKNKNDPRRTDTMMVVHYNSKEKKYDIVSIPRDTKINTTRSDKKINSAHAFGEIPLAVEEVEKLLSIKIDHYVKIDTIAFREFIDALGGIEVVVERNMYYDDPTQNLHINLKKSDMPQRLDGKQAEGFIRWRKNNDGTGYIDGDMGRIKHMQQFFNTVLAKVQSPAIIPKIPGILSIFPKYIETDLNANEILKYAMSIARTQRENIGYHIIAGEDKYIDGISYFLFDKSKNAEVNAIFNEKSSSSNIDTDNIRIKILNGSGKTGLASDFGEYIGKLGFTAYDLGDAEPTQKSKVIIYGLEKEVGDYIKKQFGIDNIDYSTKYNDFYEVEVILGADRNYIKPQ